MTLKLLRVHQWWPIRLAVGRLSGWLPGLMVGLAQGPLVGAMALWLVGEPLQLSKCPSWPLLNCK